MLVKHWMTKEVITAAPNESMQDISNRSCRKKIKFFPVVEKKKIVGVVTATDLNRAAPSKVNILNMHELLYLASQIKVSDIMTTKVHTIRVDNTLEEVVWGMMEKEVSGLPVVDGQGGLVGVITRHDIFKAFAMFTGPGHNKGVEVALRAEQSIGKFKQARDIITEHHGGRIGSVMSSVQNAPPGLLNIYIRLAIDRNHLPAMQQELSTAFTILYIVDYENDQRHIFE